MARGISGVGNDKIDFGSGVTNLTSSWTIAGWFRRTRTSQKDPIWVRYTNSTTNRQISIYVNGPGAGAGNDKLQVDVPFVAAIVTGGTAITDTNWHHVAVTRSGNSWVLYLDGGSDGTATNAASQETGANVVLGRDENTADQASLSVAEFGAWNVALTAGQVGSLHAAFAPVFYGNGLVFYAPLLGRDSPEPEPVGNQSGTLTGTVQASHTRVYNRTGTIVSVPFVTQANAMQLVNSGLVNNSLTRSSVVG